MALSLRGSPKVEVMVSCYDSEIDWKLSHDVLDERAGAGGRGDLSVKHRARVPACSIR